MIKAKGFGRSNVLLTILLTTLLLTLFSVAVLAAQTEQTSRPLSLTAESAAVSAVNRIYWTDSGSDEIARVVPGSSNPEPLLDGLPDPRGISLDLAGNRMYWTDQDTRQLLSANLDGSDVDELLVMANGDLPNVTALDLAQGKIYWTARAASSSRGKDGIWRANLDGSQPELLIEESDGLDWPVGIALDLDAGQMYWVELNSKRIRRSNLNGTGAITDLVTAAAGLERPLELALDLDGNQMYWTDEAAGVIRRSNLNGNNVQTLPIGGLQQPRGVALDLAAGKLYWTDKQASRIQRANLNGTDVETLLSAANGLSFPLSLALDLAAEITCYQLTRTHTGSGGDPTAAPPNSAGCPAGQYIAGEVINLTAAPADGWLVASWNGTDNDASTLLNNQVTMPAANHTVTVNYAPIPPTCYTLTVTHSGMGADPIFSPGSSPSCNSSQFLAGTVISLTAQPASGWRVDHWSNTDDDTSTSVNNQVTMPAADLTITAHYAIITADCYRLTLNVVGEGNTPAAAPTSSPGCGAGTYLAGTAVNLTALPSPGWQVASWSGTDDDLSTQLQNSVTMPNNDHTVTVTYTPICYRLTLQHSGSGSDPLAVPANSPQCVTGRYIVGEQIFLSAEPAADWEVDSWNGTNNDNSSEMENSLTMPAADHTVSVSYVRSAFVQRLFLPLASTSCLFAQHEREPNQPAADAFGALCLDQVFTGFPNDSNDYFFFYLAEPAHVNITMSNMTGQAPQLQLYREVVAEDNLAISVGGTPYTASCNLSAGRYYVRVFVNGNFNSVTRYELELRQSPPTGTIPAQGFDC